MNTCKLLPDDANEWRSPPSRASVNSVQVTSYSHGYGGRTVHHTEIQGITSQAQTIVPYQRYEKLVVHGLMITTAFLVPPPNFPTTWYSEVVAATGASEFAILRDDPCPRLPDNDGAADGGPCAVTGCSWTDMLPGSCSSRDNVLQHNPGHTKTMGCQPARCPSSPERFKNGRAHGCRTNATRCQ